MEGTAIEKNVFRISLPSNLEADDVPQLKTQVKTWLLNPEKLFVFDFSKTIILSRPAISELLIFARTLRKNEKHLASLNINSSILSEFKELGLTQAFRPEQTLEDAKKSAGLGQTRVVPKVDAEFLEIFIQAAKNSIEIQASTKVTLNGQLHIRKPGEATKNIAIAGIINLSSESFSGSISLCFTEKTFLQLYENMVDEKHDKIDEESQDAAGELLNIIYGQAKAKLVNEKNYDLHPAIPNILVGKEIQIQYHTRSPVMVIPFSCDAGDFHIEVVINPTEKKCKMAA